MEKTPGATLVGKFQARIMCSRVTISTNEDIPYSITHVVFVRSINVTKLKYTALCHCEGKCFPVTEL